ncbi:BtrH N-terminal domain-containing protein [Streptomyces vilmorinianum]|uniref:BtrH N-terminal domain-containing protein n=1 Tax=Streptomyces vilmorinianum TaxID=3051092 RepID=UPI0010FAE837|nr:BtrH N-terminal domain-containing protein [Streptomyces vilmorinianum]
MTVLLDRIRPWRHDLGGCLHGCLATLLEHRGVEALPVLGAAWTFRHFPGGVRREEYYYPCASGESLLSALAPYHPVRSRWHEPADAGAGWREVREQLAAGHAVAVAVDNFHLPFRPAYRDVHSNHMVVVHGYDEERGTVRVLDSVPPAFHGDIALADLTASRDSGNELVHERDMFFTGVRIGNRWLSVELDCPPEDFPVLDRAEAHRVIGLNLAHFAAPANGDAYTGLAGQQAFLEECVKRLGAGEDVRDELFVAAGAALACTAVHADWLGHAGRTLGLPGLVEQARSVDRVAHHWSAVRIMAGLTRGADAPPGLTPERLSRRVHALMKDHESALYGLEHERAAL